MTEAEVEVDLEALLVAQRDEQVAELHHRRAHHVDPLRDPGGTDGLAQREAEVPQCLDGAVERRGIDDDVHVAHHARGRRAVQRRDHPDAFEGARGDARILRSAWSALVPR